MINIVGIGLGDSENITLKAVDIIKRTNIIIGSKRQIKSIKNFNKNANYIEYKKLTDLIKYINENIENNICVLASGEPNLYGISTYIINQMKPYEDINIFCGISSISYLFSKVKLSMNDVYITSSHGRELDEDMLLISKKTAMFTDDKLSIYDIAQIYIRNNQNPKFIIGENLSSEKEKIIEKYAIEVEKEEKYSMYVLIILR